VADADLIMWIDPGKVTGVAAWEPRPKLFWAMQDKPAQICQDLEARGKELGPRLHLGWEQFIITPGSKIKHDQSASQTIGMLDWLCDRWDITRLPPQPSSARNLGMAGGKLETLGWDKRGPHAKDAAAHLLSWLIRNGLLPDDLMALLKVAA
jgi:hypothetical protein